MVVAVVLCRSSGEQHTATTLIDFPNGAGLGLGGGLLGVFIHFLFCGFIFLIDAFNGNMYSSYVMWYRVTYCTSVVFLCTILFC